MVAEENKWLRGGIFGWWRNMIEEKEISRVRKCLGEGQEGCSCREGLWLQGRAIFWDERYGCIGGKYRCEEKICFEGSHGYIGGI